MKKTFQALLYIAVLAPTVVFAQTTSFLNTSVGLTGITLENSNNSNALAIGDVLQFGYYTGATNSSTLFSGTWVPLTGIGGANSAFTNTSIGYDSSQGADVGTFAFSLTFTNGSSTSGVSLPSVGQIMSILFYNGTTLTNSSYYGGVSDTNWLWANYNGLPQTQMNFSLSDLGVTWLNNKTAYTGTLYAVPEPGSIMLFALGIGSFLLIVSKRRKLSRLS